MPERSFNDIAQDILDIAEVAEITPQIEPFVEEWFATLTAVRGRLADPVNVKWATDAVCDFDPDAAAYRQCTEAWVRVALAAVSSPASSYDGVVEPPKGDSDECHNDAQSPAREPEAT